MSNLEQLLIDVKESLERQIGELDRKVTDGFAGMKAEFEHINTRFDNQAARLDRQAALQQTGSRWSAGINDWAEKVDSALQVKDREIAELRERLKKLEDRPDAAA